MTYSLSGAFGWSGGGKGGATVDLWAASRFVSPPAENAAPPSGNPDAGPVTTGTTYGSPGGYTITGITTYQDYYLRVQYGGQTYWQEQPAGLLAGVPGTVSGNVLAHLHYNQFAGPYTLGTSLAAFDATNLALSVVAPPSGIVRLTFNCELTQNSGPDELILGLTSSPSSGVFSHITTYVGGLQRLLYDDFVTGLTAGTTYTLGLAGQNYTHTGTAQVNDFVAFATVV